MLNQTPNTVANILGLSTPGLSSAGKRETSQTTQEVGLEAAILERKRNSSLAEKSGAEDIRGSSEKPKTWIFSAFMQREW